MLAVARRGRGRLPKPKRELTQFERMQVIAWSKLGLLLVRPADLSDPWVRNYLTREARRMAEGRGT